MKRQLMLEQWNEFARRVLPTEAPATQKQEMRRAFYAGAQCILFRLIAGLAPESEPTTGDIQMLEDIHQELQQFARDVIAGKA